MYIDFKRLEEEINELNVSWNSKKPFKYIVIDDFLNCNEADKILEAFPAIDESMWNNTTYINQKNKFVKTEFSNIPIINAVFDEFKSKRLMGILERITEVHHILPDDELFGAGLHQSIKGAFLDVHVDFNIHPKTGFHRRMNLLVYLNKDWKTSYNGYLELWDMDKKEQIEYIEPKFNRAVIFETNEVSFHGHPKPLNTPRGISRKSLSVYYYTKTRPENELALEHNTIYANTQGVSGLFKNLKSALRAAGERLIGNR